MKLRMGRVKLGTSKWALGIELPPPMSGRGREAMGRTPKVIVEDDYETEQKKQAAADVLYQYSQFVMVCIGEEVRPSDLRLHLMKEISGMPTTLKKEPLPVSPDSTGEPSSSGTMKRDKSRSC